MGRPERWLLDELPGLVADGVLDDAAAERLRRRYADAPDEPEVPARRPVDAAAIGRIVLAVLGATLVGSGVILLLAHNWDALGRPLRAAIAFGSMVGPQALAAWVLARRPMSEAWREGAGVAWVLGVGASLALVSQTFHLQGELSDFLWTWIALALPVPWLLRAAFPAVLVLAGVAAWPLAAPSHERAWMLVGLAALTPGVVGVARDPAPPIRAHLVGWAAVVALLAAAVAFDELGSAWMLLPASTLGALAASAALAGPAWRKPAGVVGRLGAATLMVTLSVSGTWARGATWGRLDPIDATMAVLLGLVAVAGAAWLVSRERWVEALAPTVPLVALVGLAAAEAVDPLFAAIGIDVVVGGAALAAAAVGLREGRLGRTNGGLALFSALLVVRFFDSEVSAVVRGLAFIAIGVAFLAVNARVLAVRREAR